MRSHPLLTALVAAAVATAVAAPQAGAKDVNYHAEVSAQGTYEIHKKRETQNTLDTMDFKATFSYVGNYSDVVFRNGRLLSVGEELTPDFDATVIQHRQLRRFNDITTTYDCLGDGEDPVPGGVGRLVEVEGGKLGFRPGDRLPVMAHGCDVNQMSFVPGVDLVVPGWSTGSPDDLPAIGSGPVDLLWNNPPDAIGKDYVEDIIEMGPQQASGVSCPGWDEDTVSCKLTWSGGVKMWKDSEQASPPVIKAPEMVLDVGPAPPIYQAPEIVIDLPPVVTAPEMVLELGPRPPVVVAPEMVLDLGPRDQGLSPDGATVNFNATCPAGCDVNGTIAPAGPPSGHASRAVRPARQKFHFTLPAGQAKRGLKVRLTPTMRRQVRRARGATVTFTATANGGKPVRRTMRLRLRAVAHPARPRR